LIPWNSQHNTAAHCSFTRQQRAAGGVLALRLTW